MKQPLSFTNELRSKKLRKTALRIFLLTTLQKSGKPLSADEMLCALARTGMRVHKTSVYRQLLVLKKSRLILEVQLGETKKRYELYPEQHHHHAVCMDCGSIEDVHAERDLAGLEQKITQEKKFRVTHHTLEFFGVCAACSA